MKQVMCFMSPSKGYKTHNKFHNYHMKRKFISDSSYHMLKPQTNRKLRFYRIFLPILLRETRIGDVIHRLGHLNFSKYVSTLCHNSIYEIEIFHFTSLTCDKKNLKRLWDIKQTICFIKTVWNENTFQILYLLHEFA